MQSILITGCNRGIGLGFIKYLTENNGQRTSNIFATCRNPDNAPELVKLAEKCKNIRILKADLREEVDIVNVANNVTSILNGAGLDVLINNAGISSKFTRLNLVKEKDLTDHFRINTIAPILMTKAVLPLLKLGRNEGRNNGIVINMSSILGSMQENTTGGFYPYRTSKAALNAATRSMGVDLKDQNITVISLHPGWVKTEMGGPQAPLTVETSVENIMKFIKTITPQHSGLFFSYDGKQLPW